VTLKSLISFPSKLRLYRDSQLGTKTIITSRSGSVFKFELIFPGRTCSNPPTHPLSNFCLPSPLSLFSHLDLQAGPRPDGPGVYILYTPEKDVSAPTLYHDCQNTQLEVLHIDRKKPFLQRGFPMYCVPSSRTVCKRTSLEEPGTNPSTSNDYESIVSLEIALQTVFDHAVKHGNCCWKRSVSG